MPDASEMEPTQPDAVEAEAAVEVEATAEGEPVEVEQAEVAVEAAVEPVAPSVDMAAYNELVGRVGALESANNELTGRLASADAELVTLRAQCAAYELSAALVATKLPSSAGRLVSMAYSSAMTKAPIGPWLASELANPMSPLAVLASLNQPSADPRSNLGSESQVTKRPVFGG